MVLWGAGCQKEEVSALNEDQTYWKEILSPEGIILRGRRAQREPLQVLTGIIVKRGSISVRVVKHPYFAQMLNLTQVAGGPVTLSP